MTFLELRLPPVPLAIAFGALMWGSVRLTPSWRVEIPWTTGLGLLLGAVGGVLAMGGVAAFRSARTTTNPLRPQAATAMVTSGVYRLSRNPMYAGLILGLMGWAVHLAHPLPFVFLPLLAAYLDRFQIQPEERALAERFGTDYSDYRKKVRRWL